MLKTIVCVIALLLLPRVATAQEKYIELLRSDLRTQAVAIVTEAMQLSDAESTVFWPIYREYELERGKIGDERLTLIKLYAENFEQMTDETAKQIANDWFKLQERRLKLWNNYYKKFEKELSSITAARFIQVENQLNLLIDLQLAQELPLLERGTQPNP